MIPLEGHSGRRGPVLGQHLVHYDAVHYPEHEHLIRNHYGNPPPMDEITHVDNEGHYEYDDGCSCLLIVDGKDDGSNLEYCDSNTVAPPTTYLAPEFKYHQWTYN